MGCNGITNDALLYFEVPHSSHLDSLPGKGIGFCSVHMLTKKSELEGFFRIREIKKCFDLLRRKQNGQRHLLHGYRHGGSQDRLLIVSPVTENWNDNILRISIILIEDGEHTDSKGVPTRGVFHLSLCRDALARFERRFVVTAKKNSKKAKSKKKRITKQA